MLSFLSKHSTRDPGVCRDEIAIAIGVKGGNIQTILVESEQEVQPPVNIGHIQWLDMHDWKGTHGVVRSEKDEHGNAYTVGDAAWEQWYQAKLAEIVRVVESDESRRFAGEIETLNGHLKPIKSEARICQLLSKGFYGRQWLFEAVENWRRAITESPSPLEGERAGVRGESHSRLFWIMGAPGVGKSAFAAQLTHTRGDTVIAAQFCEWDKADHRDARRVVRSLAFQLATRLPDYRKLLLTLPEIAELDRKDAAELFDYLLANPLRSVINGGRQRYLIVIDALDEAGKDGCNPLVDMLARNASLLPNWIGIVATSRPEEDVTGSLKGLGGLNPVVLDTATESNRADIRDYLRHELATQLQNRLDAGPLVEQILEKSEGVFFYVELFRADVLRGHISLDRPEQFPQGLSGIFRQYFKRQFSDLKKFRRDVRPALRAVLAARGSLPVAILQRLFNWQDEELRDFTRPLASLIPTTTEAGHEVIKPYHKSLADWVTDEAKAGKYFVSVQEGHRLLGEYCFLQWQAGLPFAISEVIYHLQFDTTSDKMLRVFLNPAYYEKKDSNCGRVKLYEDLKCFSVRPIDRSVDFAFDDWPPEIRTLFSIAALILLNNGGQSSATILRLFIEGGCNHELLEIEREKLKPEILNAELTPRIRRAETNHYAANTAHFYKDSTEYFLKAEDAALALKPVRMVDCLRKALRFYAIASCDTDPIGAVNIAIQETAEEFDATLSVLQEVAFRLIAGIAKPHAVMSGELPIARESPQRLDQCDPDSTKECIIGKTEIERPLTISKYRGWCDLVDYSGRGYPQDMDFVCRKCGHCEPVVTPNDVPQACPKCGDEGQM